MSMDRWNEMHPADAKNTHTLEDAPESAETIDDLGNNPRLKGETLGEPFLSRRLKFQVLLRPARAAANSRKWATRWDSKCGLYATGGPSRLAKQMSLVPLHERMRVVMTPANAGSLESMIVRLNKADIVRALGGSFTVVNGKAQATIPIDDFFRGVAGQEAMAERVTNAVASVLDAVGNQDSVPASAAAASQPAASLPSIR